MLFSFVYSLYDMRMDTNITHIDNKLINESRKVWKVCDFKMFLSNSESRRSHLGQQEAFRIIALHFTLRNPPSYSFKKKFPNWPQEITFFRNLMMAFEFMDLLHYYNEELLSLIFRKASDDLNHAYITN